MHSIGALALLAAAPFRVYGQVTRDTQTVQDDAPESLLIRNATVLSMDSTVGDHAQADVLIRAGKIVAVGANIDAHDTAMLDARGMIALPGLINRHWHMWNSLARSYAPTASGTRFFQAIKTLSAAFRPQDNHLAVRCAFAEAISGDITHVMNWAHNIRSPEHAEAELHAMRESGASGRFLYGYAQDASPTTTNDFADIERVRKQYFNASDNAINLGVAIRGPERTPRSTWQTEMAFAQRQRLPLSVHVSVTRDAQKQQAIEHMRMAGFLDAATELVHVTHASDGYFEHIAAAKSSVVITPLTEMRVGYGVTPVKRMLDGGIRPSIGNDTTVFSGNADLFGVVRVVLNLANGQAENELAVSARCVLEMATIDAARSLGLESRIESLSPGKQADVILVDVNHVDAAPLIDPIAFVTEDAQPAHVRHVIARGRFLKRDGRLTGIDTAQLVRDVDETWDYLHRITK
ncbi:hypothetical protein BHUM_05847c [Candidatus Burkholderia humilis]|nr:hypothetical protein BHUM_05847c [Candidatus Burkholderia humilis]